MVWPDFRRAEDSPATCPDRMRQNHAARSKAAYLPQSATIFRQCMVDCICELARSLNPRNLSIRLKNAVMPTDTQKNGAGFCLTVGYSGFFSSMADHRHNVQHLCFSPVLPEKQEAKNVLSWTRLNTIAFRPAQSALYGQSDATRNSEGKKSTSRMVCRFVWGR